MNHKLESRLPGEISTTSYMHVTTLMAESEEELKTLLMKVKEEREKMGLNSTFKKLRSSNPIPSLNSNKRGNNGNTDRFHLLLGRKTMTNLDSVVKGRDITYLTKIYIGKAMKPSHAMWGQPR